MPSPQARAERTADRLLAAGFMPRLTDHDDTACIEMEVPEPVSAGSWQALVTALEAADWFGLVHSSARGSTVWAAFTKEAPATVGSTVRGRTHQL